VTHATLPKSKAVAVTACQLVLPKSNKRLPNTMPHLTQRRKRQNAEASNMDGKSQAWRDAADRLLLALTKENKFIVADMVIVFLESADYGLDDYTPLGGVFKRAAKKGIIKKVDRPTKQALWASQIYKPIEVSA
jgi:hypothetical protein